MATYNTKTKSTPKSYSTTGTIGKIAQRAWTIKQQISELEEQLSPLKEQMEKHFIKMKITRIDAGCAQIQYKRRNKFTYSVKLQNEMLKIQQMQEAEQLSGVAINNPTFSVAIATSPLAAVK